MGKESRRTFLMNAGKLMLGSVALGAVNSLAAEEHTHMHGGAGNGLSLDATLESTCATCQFWGGMRRISEDRKQVVAQSMGWCNNPDSPNYQKLTAADHLMNKAGIWKKWAAL